MSDPFAAAQRIADAVLYEGYLLYPYHASSSKNRVRFQFGVVVPRAHGELDPSETWHQQTELLVVPLAPSAPSVPSVAEAPRAQDPRVTIRVRFLQLQARELEAAETDAPGGFRPVPLLAVGEDEIVAWEEAIEGAVDIADVSLADLIARGEGGRAVPFTIDGGRDIEMVADPAGPPTGRIVRTRWPIMGRVLLTATPVDGFIRLTVRVENLTPDTAADGRGEPAASRDKALRQSLLGCHTLLSVATARSSRRPIRRPRPRLPRRPAGTSRSGPSSSARRARPISSCPRRSSCRTTRRWRPRARVTCSMGPRSTRS